MKTMAKWDTAELLNSEADVVAYLSAALEDGDTALLTVALGNIARAKGITQLAKETGVTRDGLYKALSPDGNPSFSTINKIIRALGLRLDVVTTA